MKIDNVVNVVKKVADNPNVSRAERHISEMFQPIEGTKVSKGLTQIDRGTFQCYVASKPFAMGITKEEIEAVSKSDGVDFLSKSYELITKKLGLKENVRPPVFMNKIQGDGFCAYIPSMNVIICDLEKVGKMSKDDTFAALRHELQHFVQNTSIMRHETLGPKAIKIRAKEFVESQKKTILTLLDKSDEELIAMCNQGLVNQNGLNLIAQGRTLVRNNDMAGFNKLFEPMEKTVEAELIKWREQLIQQMGLIKSDSSLTPKIQRYFDDFNSVGYYNQDKSIDYSKYFSCGIEREAIKSQYAAAAEFAQAECWPAYFKQKTVENIKENEGSVNKILDQLA